jgi:tetratricopeptide (TPR) repeat protein
MNLATDLLHQIGDLNLSHNVRAQLRCKLAKQLEEAGNYEAAREAMGELWQAVGETPVVEGLDDQTKAEVLLRAGVLTGWLGSTEQVNGAQEAAKNFISASIVIFEAAQECSRVAEANIELAVCYWREGAFDEARVTLSQAMERLDENDGDLKALALIRSAVVEKADNRLLDALRILNDAIPLLGTSTNNTLRGKFHNDLGMVLKNLWVGQSKVCYVDRALIEFAAASFYFEQAGHARYQAYVENNLGLLFCIIGKYPDAHEHLDRAQMLFTTLKDSVHLAQVDETRARVMLAEGRLVEAEKTAHRAVRTFQNGDEQSLLAEALITHGISLARLGRHEQARSTLERASDVAQQAGDPESAGQAALVMIEELDKYLSNDDLKVTVERARELLKNTQDISSLRRLGTCACHAVSVIHASARFPSSVDWTNFSIESEWLRDEAHFIKLALRDASGSVTRAARLLGLPSHQTLVWKLNSRHQDLLAARRPAKPRRRSIIRHNEPTG